jgi:protein disulfide-isomerase A6
MDNVAKIIGAPRGVIVKFWATQCYQCDQLARDFSIASTLYGSDLLFAGVNCIEHFDICEHYDIEQFPTIRIFPPNNRDGFEYKESTDYAHLVDYIKNLSGIRARPTPLPNVIELTTVNWDTYITNTSCGIVMFSPKRCSRCIHLGPQFSQLSSAFSADGNITTATVDCTKFEKLCQIANVSAGTDYEDERPGVMFVKNGTFTNFTGSRLISPFVAEVNQQCGTHRKIDGLLDDWMGTTKEADSLAKEFLSDAADKDSIIGQMKELAGTEYYVKVMERYREKGVAQLKKDALAMKSNLEERKLSLPSLDIMKQNYNVIVRFLPSPTPKPFASRKVATAAPMPRRASEPDEIGETIL